MDPIRKRNLKLKIIAIICSILLWCYVISQLQITGAATNTVTLNYYNVASGLNIDGPETVQVTVWGFNSNIKASDINAYVDLAGLEEGVYELPVQMLPIHGAVLTKVEPSEVQVSLEEASRRSKTIDVTITADPPTGYKLCNTMVSPTNCIVKGQTGQLEKVERVMAELDLSELTGVSELTVPLVAVDKDGNALDLEVIPQQADITVLIEAERAGKNVPVTCTFSGTAADGATLSGYKFTPATVMVYGSAEELKAITEINAGSIPLSGHSSSFSRIMSLVGPENTTVYPSEVQVDVELKANAPKETIQPPETKTESTESTHTEVPAESNTETAKTDENAENDSQDNENGTENSENAANESAEN